MVKPPKSNRIQKYRRQVNENPASVMDKHISADECLKLCRQHQPNLRQRLFTPMVTLWTFIAQVLSADKSLHASTARTMAAITQSGKPGGSHDPSGYCQARYRFPVEVLIHLAKTIAQRLSDLVPTTLKWHDRHVFFVDGSGVSMPDTSENQLAYPQPSTQKEGCGFPVARIVGLFSMATGAVVDLAVGSQKLGELTLWQRLWENLKPGNVIVGDRLYGNYADICLLHAREVDLVFRIDKVRETDFSLGERLGPNDHLVTYTKPGKPSKRLTKEQWAALPDTITLREVRFDLRVRGFKRQQIVLVTTLLDNKAHTVKDLAALYHRRWEVEVDFKHLKTSMEMDILNGKKPEMVVKELWTYVLAYNLVRTLMWEAARHKHMNPLTISLMGAINEILALWPYSSILPDEQLSSIYGMLIFQIGTRKIPKRPGRHEPRVQKRRHKDFDYMTRPRKSYKAEAEVIA